MLTPEIVRRLDRLLAFREKGILTDDEFAEHLGTLTTAYNIDALIERIPVDLVSIVKKGIAYDNRRALDKESLQPEASPFYEMDICGQYYRNVAETLLELDQPKWQGLLSVVCLPSFQVEWALRLIGSEAKGYSLVLRVATAQIWSSQASATVSANRLEAALGADLAELVCEAWQKMLQRVQHPVSSGFGLDGVTYHFACHGPGIGRMAGRIWSPNSETAPGRLVALCHLLYRYVEQTEGKRDGLDGEIRQAAEWFSNLA